MTCMVQVQIYSFCTSLLDLAFLMGTVAMGAVALNFLCFVFWLICCFCVLWHVSFSCPLVFGCAAFLSLQSACLALFSSKHVFVAGCTWLVCVVHCAAPNMYDVVAFCSFWICYQYSLCIYFIAYIKWKKDDYESWKSAVIYPRGRPQCK